MKNKKYSPRQKARRRKIIIRRLFVLAVTAFVTFGIIYGVVSVTSFIKGVVYDDGFAPSSYGSNLSKKVKLKLILISDI